MICGFEGFVATVYMDRAGVPTIGYGHALTRQEIVAGTYHGVSLTPAEALELCRKDFGKAEDAVNELVTVPLSQNQFDALVSFTFNLGRGALAGSTLLTKLNDKNYIGAASEFIRWDHIGKREDIGLKGRREGEARLFLEGMPSVGGPTLDDIVRLVDTTSRQATDDVLVPAADRITLPDPEESNDKS